MSRLAVFGLALSCPALAAGAMAAGAEPAGIRLPSGATVFWQETRHDNSGGQGLTYRFRFVMPDLASRVPATSGPASDFDAGTGEDAAGRAPIDIDTETGAVAGAPADAAPDDGLIDPALLDDQPVEADAAAEEAADALVEVPVLPAAPDVLAQDPVHDDIVWLCEHWILPRIASPAPRPSQIVISLADRELPFGAYDPEAIQLFEAFRLPPDRDACEWEPW
ncbi:DUF6497 family protein [Paracoccus binzhouensis]|uniref:DUF6497 family protein n=1 Tax=Paracoccus binzhouensis TaxID=2796149 RepID=UPI0018EEDC56|nr:DUF6497 family protein [Paracoccus binzhouensis]